MASFLVLAGKLIAMRKENLCDISTRLGKIFNQKKKNSQRILTTVSQALSRRRFRQ